jgi:site-specific DNA-methyltransferase (adenine-specific)
MEPRKEIIGPCTLYLGAMEETISGIEHIDHILSDPPYLYIKTHDFDKEFDEQLFFENAKRLLPDDGFIALFGRGTSFYRWNTRLAELGFVFKEEIVWDKKRGSPCLAISRVHETISLHTKKNGKIRKCKLPYLEQKKYDIDSIVYDINRIKGAINSEAGLNEIISFLETGNKHYCKRINRKSITNPSGLSSGFSRHITSLSSIKDGMREKTIICSFQSNMIERSHPTEKPVRLAERILALISDPGDTIYDPFMGSGSFGVACINTGRKYIGSEMKPEYFDIACKRITEAWNNRENQPDLFPDTAGSAAAVRE